MQLGSIVHSVAKLCGTEGNEYVITFTSHVMALRMIISAGCGVISESRWSPVLC